MIHILVADDHAIVRRGLKQIVSDELDMTVDGEAKNAAETLEMVRKGGWDIIVLDLNMPGGNGLDVLQQIKTEFPQLPVLVLSVHPEDQFALRVIKAGGSGYLNKESAPEELVEAIRKIHAGGKYIHPAFIENLLFAKNQNEENLPHKSLSNREFQVFCKLALGMTLVEIAAELAINVKTVSTYRKRILEKLDFSSNSQLIRYAISHGLTENRD